MAGYSIQQKTYSIHIDSFEIVRVGVRWLPGASGIKLADNLQVLVSEVKGNRTSGDLERAVSSMRWCVSGNLIRLGLSVSRRASAIWDTNLREGW